MPYIARPRFGRACMKCPSSAETAYVGEHVPIVAKSQHPVTVWNMRGRSPFSFHVRSPDKQILEGNPMRNLLIAGTVGFVLTIGAAGAAYASNPNVPIWSPLSINTNVSSPLEPDERRSRRLHREDPAGTANLQQRQLGGPTLGAPRRSR
jgi:hypothetical protein